MENQNPFPLETRVATWNLLCQAANRLHQAISPIVTSAFTYVDRYFTRQTSPSSSIFTVAMAALFVSIKTEAFGASAEGIVKVFLETAAGISQEDLERVGYKYGIYSANQSNEFQQKRVLTDLATTELNLLEFLRWSFVQEYPMSQLFYITHLLKIKAGKKYEEFKARAKEAFFQVFISESFNERDYLALAVAAIFRAVDVVGLRDFISSDWIDEYKIDVDKKKVNRLLRRFGNFELFTPDPQQQ